MGDTIRVPADVETSYLHLRTGSKRQVITIYFYDKEGDMTGGIVIEFNTPVMYLLGFCYSEHTLFPTSLPVEADKHWVVEKRGYRTIMYCNGKQIFNITASSVTCSYNFWKASWGKEVSEIELGFGVYGTASYYIG